jgi:hypothetical protein
MLFFSKYLYWTIAFWSNGIWPWMGIAFWDHVHRCQKGFKKGFNWMESCKLWFVDDEICVTFPFQITRLTWIGEQLEGWRQNWSHPHHQTKSSPWRSWQGMYFLWITFKISFIRSSTAGTDNPHIFLSRAPEDSLAKLLTVFHVILSGRGRSILNILSKLILISSKRQSNLSGWYILWIIPGLFPTRCSSDFQQFLVGDYF